MGLPPQLDTLEYAAEPAAGGVTVIGDGYTPISLEHLTAAAEAIVRLPELKQLTVQQCLGQDLPLALIRRLPHSIEVGSSCFGSVQMFAEQYMCMAATASVSFLTRYTPAACTVPRWSNTVLFWHGASSVIRYELLSPLPAHMHAQLHL